MSAATATLQTMSPAREGEGKRALITGLAGFTGHYVEQELRAAGYQIFGTVNPGHPGGEDAPEGHYAVDLTDRAAVAAMVREVQPDVVAPGRHRLRRPRRRRTDLQSQ